MSVIGQGYFFNISQHDHNLNQYHYHHYQYHYHHQIHNTLSTNYMLLLLYYL